MTHTLKTWPVFYEQVLNGEKTFEMRKDDRPFENGDTVILQEFILENNSYTGREISFTISSIIRDNAKFGLKPGYCIFSLKEKYFKNK